MEASTQTGHILTLGLFFSSAEDKGTLEHWEGVIWEGLWGS